jgi:pyruvate dehydrogenase E1 component beta subunit
MNLDAAISQALFEEMARDSRVLLMGEGVATNQRRLVEAYGSERVRHTPLAEAIIAGTAVGAAASGLRPVIDLLFAPFMAYSMDALINSAGKLRYLSGGQFEFPLVALVKTGAGWCVGGQHSHNLEAMFVHAPGLKVVMPSNPGDAKGLLKSAVRDANPVLFFADIGLVFQEGEVPEDAEHLVPLGQATIPRTGSDISLVSYGKTVGVCLQAAEQLAGQGISAEVLDLRTLKPLDSEAVLGSVRKTGRLVVIHEASGLCGVAAEISALVADEAFASLTAPVRRLTGPDAPAASSWALEQAALPKVAEVVDTVRTLTG